MKAVVYSGYGSADVLRVEDVAIPTPADNEVLIKVRAASVNAPDWRIMKGEPFIVRLMFGLRKPRFRPGLDVAGVVEVVGKNVTQFKPGDAVFGVCKGAFAEYACMLESRVVIKPQGVTFEQAASAPVAAFTALQGLRDKAHVQPGQTVLINGASGGVGTFAVQIAKSLGAEVTGVCSTANVEMVRSIGADHVIDYTQVDFTKSGKRYDVIFEGIGNHSLSAIRDALNPKGVCVIFGGPKTMTLLVFFGFLIRPPLYSLFGGHNFAMFMARSNQPDLNTMSQLMEAGKVTPVIDKQYPLSETAEALRYVEQGHARGKVVITVASQPPAPNQQ